MEEKLTPVPGQQPAEEGLVYNLYYWLQTLVLAVAVIVLLFTFAGRITRVEGDSMLQTLHNGDLLLLQSAFYTPKAGDIVVLNKTADETVSLLGGEAIVKRMIATEGQTVAVDYETSTVYVDGNPLEEPYVWEHMDRRTGPYSGQIPFVVPEGSVFVMGDNRNNSTDSRHELLGPVDQGYILGRAICILFPFSDMGLL